VDQAQAHYESLMDALDILGGLGDETDEAEGADLL
jgi:hypothetical protein